MGRNNMKFHPDHIRKKIQASMLVNRLHDHILGKIELSMSQVHAINILLKKCVPDLVRTVITADITHRYVVQLPDVLDKADWLRKYGDPRQIEGTTDDPPTTMQ